MKNPIIINDVIKKVKSLKETMGFTSYRYITETNCLRIIVSWPSYCFALPRLNS